MKTETTRNLPFSGDGDKLVYIRRLALDEARSLVPEDALAELDSLDDLFSVHTADGQRVAIVEGRDAAFAAARAYDLKPRSVH